MNCPIRKFMRIKKDPINFEFLSLEIIANCPSNESEEFVEGYLQFVITLFDKLDCLSDIFWNYKEGTCDIDFKYLFKITNEDFSESTMSDENLRGSRSAEKVALESMVFAFKWEPNHQAA